jgi:thiamine pyrophosphate-dependent acetolactate synthase large subunit-like protein
LGPGLTSACNHWSSTAEQNWYIIQTVHQAKRTGTSYFKIQSNGVHPDAVIESLTQAMQTSILQRSVSHLSIPTDVFSMTTAIQPREQPQVPFSGPEIIQQAD